MSTYRSRRCLCGRDYRGHGWCAAGYSCPRQELGHGSWSSALKKLEDQRKQREKTRWARKAAGDRKRADKAKKIAAKIAMKAMKAMGAAEE